MEKFFRAAEFDWDVHNIEKNWKKHRVKFTECEEIFFDPSLKVLQPMEEDRMEKRFLAFGKTKEGRLLFVVFTERGGKIRIISARDMSRKERRAYDEKIKEDASI